MAQTVHTRALLDTVCLQKTSHFTHAIALMRTSTSSVSEAQIMTQLNMPRRGGQERTTSPLQVRIPVLGI